MTGLGPNRHDRSGNRCFCMHFYGKWCPLHADLHVFFIISDTKWHTLLYYSSLFLFFAGLGGRLEVRSCRYLRYYSPLGWSWGKGSKSAFVAIYVTIALFAGLGKGLVVSFCRYLHYYSSLSGFFAGLGGSLEVKSCRYLRYYSPLR